MFLGSRKLARKVLPAASICLVLVVALFFANDYLPYGFNHFRQIHTVQLVIWLSGWKNSGADERKLRELTTNEKSSARSVITPFATNIVYDGKQYESVVKLDSADLRERGALFGTRNAEVFWIGRYGKVEQLHPRAELNGQMSQE